MFTARKRIKFATRNLQSFSPHLDYVAALLGNQKSKFVITHKIQLKNRTVCDKNETSLVIWLNKYKY